MEMEKRNPQNERKYRARKNRIWRRKVKEVKREMRNRKRETRMRKQRFQLERKKRTGKEWGLRIEKTWNEKLREKGIARLSDYAASSAFRLHEKLTINPFSTASTTDGGLSCSINDKSTCHQNHSSHQIECFYPTSRVSRIFQNLRLISTPTHTEICAHEIEQRQDRTITARTNGQSFVIHLPKLDDWGCRKVKNPDAQIKPRNLMHGRNAIQLHTHSAPPCPTRLEGPDLLHT